MTPDDSEFHIIETTIAELHAAVDNDEVTFKDVVRQYLDRIEAWNDRLNAVITINYEALPRAEQLDEEWASSGKRSPIHGAPVVLKDNIDTADLPTTSGSVLFADTVPPEDAFLTRKIRENGGIIIAKANLGEFSSGSLSALGGQTRNPYDRTRDTGGSSSGTGASISANLGLLGIGTDTVGSVRHPAGFCALVGLRPTTGLLSRNGIVPISNTQDTAGPMTRTVEDTAAMMDVLVGYDSGDAATAVIRDNAPDSYLACLREDGLEGIRLGVSEHFFGPKTDEGTDPAREAAAVTDVIDAALETMEHAGATIVSADRIPDIGRELDGYSVADYEFRREFDAYLEELGDEAPVDSAEAVSETDTIGGYVDFEGRLHDDDGMLHENCEYLRTLHGQTELRRRILDALEEHDLDSLVYPMASRVPSQIEEDRLYRTSSNAKLAAYAGLPAITVPAGFDAEWGTPVGIEFLAGPFEEDLLFEIAYAYEQLSRERVPPRNFGSID
jgi:Asp-tRNA(Asn)/Glu-tRNA(Gln) amidotransferase A subunit family amidase